MEYAANGTLKQRYDEHTPLPLPTIVSYVKQVASALQYVHDCRLVHCDVKPANLLLRANNEVILSDFGIVAATRTTAAPTLEHVYGTAPYMAPEQAQGRPRSASDQYSLAIIVYQWLSGELPFQGTPDAILQQHLLKEPPSLRRKDTGAKIPLSIERVVRKALAKEPQDRYRTVQDFANALEAAIRSTQALPLLTVPLTPPPSVVRQPSEKNVLVVSSPGQSRAPNDVTISNTSPLSPIPPPPPPVLLTNPVIQEEYQLFQRFQALQNEYQSKQQQIVQWYTEKAKLLLQEKQQAMTDAEKAMHTVRQYVDKLRSPIQRNGWENLVRISTNLMLPLHLLDSPSPPQRDLSATYAQQMAGYATQIDTSSRTANSMLGLYQQARNLLLTYAIIAGCAALILAILLSIQLGASFVSTLLLPFLCFVILWLLCLYPHLLVINKAYGDIQHLEHLAEGTYQQRCTTIEHTYIQDSSQLQGRRDADTRQLGHDIAQRMLTVQSDFAKFIHALGYAVTDWQDRQQWEQWHPLSSASTSVTRLGSLTFGPALPIFPALVPCPSGCNIILQVEGRAKKQAVSAIQSLILRLLATQQPGKVHFTFIDPEQLGENVNAFFSLAFPHNDHILGTDKALVHGLDIEQRLRQLTDYIVHAKHLHATLPNYHVAAVFDFPSKFITVGAIEDLVRIARNGPPVGVSTIFVIDTSRPLSAAFDQQLEVLEQGAIVLTWNEENQHLIWQNSPFHGGQLTLDTVPYLDAPPPEDVFKRILRQVSHEVETSTSVQQQFSRRVPSSGNSLTRGAVELGHSIPEREPITITFRRRNDSNLLIIGKEEETALDILLITMMDIIRQYSPAQAQFHVVDLFPEGEITTYTSNPFELIKQAYPTYFSRPFVKWQHMRDELASLFTSLNNELKERAYGKLTSSSASLYLFIQGLQFAETALTSDRSTHGAAGQFSSIMRNGSLMGIHTLIWSDKCSSLENILSNDVLQPFDYRLVLPISSREDVTKLLERSDAMSPGKQQAYLFSRGKERFEIFRPYRIASQAELQSIIAGLRH